MPYSVHSFLISYNKRCFKSKLPPMYVPPYFKICNVFLQSHKHKYRQKHCNQPLSGNIFLLRNRSAICGDIKCVMLYLGLKGRTEAFSFDAILTPPAACQLLSIKHQKICLSLEYFPCPTSGTCKHISYSSIYVV